MKGRRLLWEMFIPATAGILCCCALQIVQTLPAVSAATGAAEALKDLIDSIGFHQGLTSSLIKALLTGDRSSLDSATVSAFRKSGASHILALSGLHLGIIYSFIRKLTSFLGNRYWSKAVRTGLVIGFCSFYTIMTGAGPSIVRALLFIITNEACSLDPERKKNGMGVLLMAFIIQVIAMPEVIHSIGFQLSYLAMCGIFLVGIPMQGWYPGDGSFNLLKKIWDAASVCISCQLFTAPIAWHYFHSFPVHFILTNILALPVTEAAMILSITTIILQACGLHSRAASIARDFSFRILTGILEIISDM